MIRLTRCLVLLVPRTVSHPSGILPQKCEAPSVVGDSLLSPRYPLFLPCGDVVDSDSPSNHSHSERFPRNHRMRHTDRRWSENDGCGGCTCLSSRLPRAASYERDFVNPNLTTPAIHIIDELTDTRLTRARIGGSPIACCGTRYWCQPLACMRVMMTTIFTGLVGVPSP